ncbi:hypothetical protein M1K46_03140 [Fictibacillus sp. WQ 8-8]|uniref:hypothetical protein n=1 Tax=Fictibacillus sp. WQ 8-8 TaxID=2938788 RepID=UPI00210DC573|nr:hypothetical protein [Fictibacillus sp. WQ 8-8]MCQ6264661.1 hypothetical protein [Fictibacillus sp. WQ 8-8]
MVKMVVLLCGIVFILTIYTAISHNFKVIPCSQFFSGCMLFVLGVAYKREKEWEIYSLLQLDLRL